MKRFLLAAAIAAISLPVFANHVVGDPGDEDRYYRGDLNYFRDGVWYYDDRYNLVTLQKGHDQGHTMPTYSQYPYSGRYCEHEGHDWHDHDRNDNEDRHEHHHMRHHKHHDKDD